MAWEFKRSQRYLDKQAYRQAYKQWVCLDIPIGGPRIAAPIVPETLGRVEVIRIQREVQRLYGKENDHGKATKREEVEGEDSASRASG